MPTARLRRWTRHEYEQMVDADIFGPEDHIELLDGEIVEMMPQGTKHVGMVAVIDEILRQSLPVGGHIRQQGPIALDSSSEPEPDIVVAALLP